jgi:hypothetical protein
MVNYQSPATQVLWLNYQSPVSQVFMIKQSPATRVLIINYQSPALNFFKAHFKILAIHVFIGIS